LKEIGDLNKASIFKILPHVLSAPKQVSSWNPDDPNLNVNLCPQPKSEAEKIAWKMALNVATEAVNDTPKFLNDTNCVPYLYYTSNSIPAWAGQLQQVTSQSFTNKECTKFAANKRFLMLWDETALTEKIKKEISPQQNKFYSKNDYLSEF
jgi:hypothetical protein